MKLALLLSAYLFLSVYWLAPAMAQTRQMIAELGIRILVPEKWEWYRRDSNEIFIDCSPQIVDRFGCSIIVTMLKAAPGQTEITQADRKLWRSWQAATGLRGIISARDRTLAGFPAYEIISEDPLRTMRLFVLIPQTSRVYDIAYFAGTHTNKNADYHRYKPAVDAALQTLWPTSD